MSPDGVERPTAANERRARGARIRVRRLAVLGAAAGVLAVTAGCGVSVSVAQRATSTRPAPEPSPSASTPDALPSGDASSSSPGSSSTAFPPLSGPQSVDDLMERLVPPDVLGKGFTTEDAWSSSHPTSDPGFFDITSGTAQCRDFMRSFVTADAPGGIAAKTYAVQNLVDDENNGVEEWAGYFTGTGAQRTMTALAKDIAGCRKMTIAKEDAGTATLTALPAAGTPKFGAQTRAILLRVATGTSYVGVIGRFGDMVVYYQDESAGSAAIATSNADKYASIMAYGFQS